jgi:MFS family permease
MLENESAPKKGGFHYGYLVVAGGFLTQIIIMFGMRGFSMVLTSVQATLGVSMAEVGLIASYYGLIGGLSGLIWGFISDKIGPKITLTVAAATTSLGFLLFGLIGSFGYLVSVVVFSIAGFGSGGIFNATIPKLINAWFVPEKRGHAMRFITPGAALTGMVMGVAVPIMLATLQWTGVFVVFGVIGLVITAFIFFIIKNSPYEKNLAPVGAPAGTQPAPPVKLESSNSYAPALRLKITWHIGIMYIVYQFYWVANSTYYFANLGYMGFQGPEAGLTLTIASICSIFAMQLWGPLSDKIGRKNTLMLSLGLATVWAIILFFVCKSGPPLPLMYVMIAIMQIIGATAPVCLAAFADYFPQEYNSTCNAVVAALSSIGNYLAPWICGMVIDSAGGDITMFYWPVAAGALICGIITATWPKPSSAAKASAPA